MNELVIAKDVCHKCKYYTKQEGCCDYLSLTGHSRIFNSKGIKTYDPKYCDKYEPGSRRRSYNGGAR